ncbi:hypothetical protein HKCCE3408_08620 [Rhodobacterales bacterium HKCCE3408]|nr:hypothetical protein [Rhodobacterales bacterium HKCCE3408]
MARFKPAYILPAIALLSVQARADCLAYIVDACHMSSEVADGFWIGEYSVEAGPGTLTTSAGTYGMPAEGMQAATVFQMGDNLVIHHPERELNAELVGVGGWEPSWNDEPPEGQLSLEDLTLTEAGCSSNQLPRWTAPTESDDGVPMRLDLVAVSPTVIAGRLSATGVRDGTAFTYMRLIRMTRQDFPHDELDETVLPNALCETQCGNGVYFCPDYQ